MNKKQQLRIMRDLERMLDAKDMEILLNLQKNPLATLSQISQQINLSVSNTSARLKRLEQTKRIYQGVHADLNTSALELEIYDFFFSVQQKQHLIYLEEKFSRRHPYVLFRNRITGKENGLFLQFRAPQSTLELIIET
ncbi:MAG: Lrp/AsnC family transcriptional regulator, partial [Candidatus Heimdallarchaeota archaeon]